MIRSYEIINNENLRNKIIDLMREASNEIIKIYKNPTNRIEYKNDNSPLTEADLAANKILSENTGKTIKTIEKDTNRDNFMSAERALEYGLIDQIVTQR